MPQDQDVQFSSCSLNTCCVIGLNTCSLARLGRADGHVDK